MSDLFASVPPQVQIGTQQATFNVLVKSIGTGRVSVTLKSPDGRTTLRTKHADDDEGSILLAIAAIANDARPGLERDHRAMMTAKGYRT